MKVIVEYNDGMEETIVEKDEFAVAARIEETVKSNNFKILPYKIVDDKGKIWGFNWSFRLEQPWDHERNVWDNLAKVAKAQNGRL